MNTSSTTILTAIDSHGVATITLNRPHCHNALTIDMIKALSDSIRAFCHNPSVKILMLRGNGASFCAGADISWMQKAVEYSQDENEIDATLLSELLQSLWDFPKPTIAVIEGNVYGGGIGLMACCKIVIASDNCQFCFSEAKLGLIPAVVAPFIVNAIGARQTYAYFLSSKSFDAYTAQRIGLCHDIAAPDKLESVINEWIKNTLAGGPQAQNAILDFIDELSTAPLKPEHFTQSIHLLAAARVSAEGQEGLTAFLQKRKPKWITQ